MADVPSFGVPLRLCDFAQSSLEQAHSDFARCIEAGRCTTDPAQGSTDLAGTNAQAVVTRGRDDAEPNVSAALDFMNKLAAPRSIPEAMQIRAEFVRERFAAMQAQTQDWTGFAQGAFRHSAEHARAALRQGADSVQALD